MTPHPQRELKWEPHWITPPELYKNLERARMAGMIDAFNYIIEGIKHLEYME